MQAIRFDQPNIQIVPNHKPSAQGSGDYAGEPLAYNNFSQCWNAATASSTLILVVKSQSLEIVNFQTGCKASMFQRAENMGDLIEISKVPITS